MADRVTLSWKGKEYEVRRATAEQSSEPAAVWQVLQDGALVTSFPAAAADGPAEARERATGWLEANQSRPPADVGRQ